jgi:hypothetical protein
MAEPQSDGSLGGLAPGQQGPAALAPRRARQRVMRIIRCPTLHPAPHSAGRSSRQGQRGAPQAPTDPSLQFNP